MNCKKKTIPQIRKKSRYVPLKYFNSQNKLKSYPVPNV